MRFVEKPDGSKPEDLPEKERAELAKAEPYFRKSKAERAADKKPSFAAYKLPSVKAKLEDLFSGKCAYCESYYSSTAPVDIEHFRPKGKVQDAPDHDGYWWLAADWDNLLPSCIDCNRKRRQFTPRQDANLTELLEDRKRSTQLTNTGKKDSFPLLNEEKRATTSSPSIKQEEPLLLNPCVDQPTDFLDFTYFPEVGASIIFPRREQSDPQSGLNPTGTRTGATDIAEHADIEGNDLRGAMSIHVYGLNRLGLVQERTRIVRRLDFLASLLDDLYVIDGEMEQSGASAELKNRILAKTKSMRDRIIEEMRGMKEPSQPYSAVAISWFDAFIAELRE